MSDFEEYIKLNYPRDYERQRRIYPDQSVEDLYSEDYKMWRHQQAKVDELQNRIDEALEDLEYPTAPWDETIASVVKVLRGDE